MLVPGIIGCIQALEAIKIASEIGGVVFSNNELLFINYRCFISKIIFVWCFFTKIFYKLFIELTNFLKFLL